MKAKLLALIIVVALSGLAVAYDRWAGRQPPAPPPTVEAFQTLPLPDTTITTLDGTSLSLAALPEPGILLHFWASWCAPCRIELPALLKRIDAADGRLALVAVSSDDDRAAMDAFLEQLPAHRRPHVYWVWDAGKTLSLTQFNTASVPETILIDRSRRMTGKIVGDPDWRSEAMGQRLAKLAR